MANVQKYTKSQCSHLFAHYERAKDKDGNYYKFGNQSIDVTKTHLNYNLAPDHFDADGNRLSQREFMKQRCSEVYCLNRKDVNTMASWVITAPRNLEEHEYDDFFKHAYEAMTKRYGAENVISAYVHKDESGRDHMHYSFVPICWDKAKDRYTVNAKKVLSKTELQRFHPWLEKEMEQFYPGRDIGLITGETQPGQNLTVEEYKKLQEAKKETKAAEQELDAIQADRLKAQHEYDTEVEVRKCEIASLDGEISDRQGTLKGLDGDISSRLHELDSLRDEIDGERNTLASLTAQRQAEDRKLSSVKNKTMDAEKAFEAAQERHRQAVDAQKMTFQKNNGVLDKQKAEIERRKGILTKQDAADLQSLRSWLRVNGYGNALVQYDYERACKNAGIDPSTVKPGEMPDFEAKPKSKGRKTPDIDFDL